MANNSVEREGAVEPTQPGSGIRVAGSEERLVQDSVDYPRGLLRIVREQGELQLPGGLDDLLATIHERIIPQLLLAHHEADTVVLLPAPGPTLDEVRTFADLSTRQDVGLAVAFVESLTARGVALEIILLDLVGPAARMLGDDWTSDERTFSEVTLGLSTLQQVVHIVGPAFSANPTNRGTVLLVAAPSEQHTLGIHVLGEFLRKAGWGVQVESALSRAEVIRLVETERVEMVGVSIANGDLVEPLTRLVTGLRRAPLNPDMAVMMGGSLDLTAAEHKQIGATFCNDAREAVRWLDEHVRLLKARDRS